MGPTTYKEKVAKLRRRGSLGFVSTADNTDEPIQWLSTAEAANRLGITPRTLYRFIDEGQLAAYRFGRVIRLKTSDVDQFIEACRIQPGTLEHLYPETVGDSSSSGDVD
jgi:excisionase family DNA binding protein